MLFVEEEEDSESGASSSLPSVTVIPATSSSTIASSTSTASSGGTMKKAPSFVNMFTPPDAALTTANPSTGSSMGDLVSNHSNSAVSTSNSSLNAPTSTLTRKVSKKKPAAPSGAGAPSASSVLALYDYTAQVDGELSFKKGDYIEVTNRDIGSDAWWEGMAHGLKGQFPKAYVKELDAAKQPATPKLPRVEALYDYDGQYDGELRMRAGDVVELISKKVEGDATGDWWEGRLNGVKGQFPRAYVKEIQ